MAPALSKHGWGIQDRGFAVEKTCANCGRATYVAVKSDELRCDGCGDVIEQCLCPDSRELA